MKTIILAGGFGTRLSEYTKLIPKPMVEIGGKPIIWHIMNHYARFGYKDFVVALGYKGEVIKNYFLQYYAQNNDFTIDLSNGAVSYINEHTRDWRVTLVDTGAGSMTGGRVLRLKDTIGNEDFMLTYGDAVSNVDISKLVQRYKEAGKLAMVTAVHPTARFGELQVDRQLARLQTDGTTNAQVEHETALTLGLVECTLDYVTFVIHGAFLGNATCYGSLVAINDDALVTISRRVGKVDAVVVVTAQVDKPATTIIAQGQTIN